MLILHTYMYVLCTYMAMHSEEVDSVNMINEQEISCYSENSLIRHSMGPENNVGLGGCWIMECLLLYLCMVTVPHIMVGLERMLDYRGVRLVRFHCSRLRTYYHIKEVVKWVLFGC